MWLVICSSVDTAGKHEMCSFYCTAALQLQSWHEQSICLSIHPSVKCMNCDKTKHTSVEILKLYERPMHLVLRHEEWVVEDVPFYLKCFKNGDVFHLYFGQNWPTLQRSLCVIAQLCVLSNCHLMFTVLCIWLTSDTGSSRIVFQSSDVPSDGNIGDPGDNSSDLESEDDTDSVSIL